MIAEKSETFNSLLQIKREYKNYIPAILVLSPIKFTMSIDSGYKKRINHE